MTRNGVDPRVNVARGAQPMPDAATRRSGANTALHDLDAGILEGDHRGEAACFIEQAFIEEVVVPTRNAAGCHRDIGS